QPGAGSSMSKLADKGTTMRGSLFMVAGLALSIPGTVAAQEKFPSKPIRMLVPFSTGSATDFMARTVGEKMSDSWGQPVVVDNRPSAGGVVASEFVVNALP